MFPLPDAVLPRGSQRIEVLVAEDEPIDLELTLRALHLAPVAGGVQVARDGQDALDFLMCQGEHAWRRGEEPLRLVMMDVKLPKLNGFDVLARLRAEPLTRLLPVVMFSSSQEQVDVVRGYQLGANSYVAKPVEFEQYLQAVQELARYWLQRNLAQEGPQATAALPR
ncbi:response regulator [Aquincola tertiaricarbonis]|uniref:Response regulator n=1 Tax=Aquincola tertiaricarbonis TaxID=391953 RepID=A0ABY4S9Z8_AQUTE|nr:response regulator [Aquincola tertiaricarbonis]URI08727.1 response regulator [Aquincola tertiaricarbonis]